MGPPKPLRFAGESHNCFQSYLCRRTHVDILVSFGQNFCCLFLAPTEQGRWRIRKALEVVLVEYNRRAVPRIRRMAGVPVLQLQAVTGNVGARAGNDLLASAILC
jgi:hypothetical protein